MNDISQLNQNAIKVLLQVFILLTFHMLLTCYFLIFIVNCSSTVVSIYFVKQSFELLNVHPRYKEFKHKFLYLYMKTLSLYF